MDREIVVNSKIGHDEDGNLLYITFRYEGTYKVHGTRGHTKSANENNKVETWSAALHMTLGGESEYVYNIPE